MEDIGIGCIANIGHVRRRTYFWDATGLEIYQDLVDLSGKWPDSGVDDVQAFVHLLLIGGGECVGFNITVSQVEISCSLDGSGIAETGIAGYRRLSDRTRLLRL